MKEHGMEFLAAGSFIGLVLVLIGYLALTRDAGTALLVLAVVLGVLAIIAMAITYAYYQQKNLLGRVSEILYRKVAFEEEQEEKADRRDSIGEDIVEEPDTSFRDIVDMESCKAEIRRAVVLPVSDPDTYRRYMKRKGTAILLYGPPGCGKTLIARGAAGEAGVPILHIHVSDITSKWFGQSERNMRRAFEMARKRSPCILFVDEIDALGLRREGSYGEGGRRILTEMLVQMEKLEGVVFIAATNAPWDLDPALRRSGRFDRKIFVPQPDEAGRRQLFRKYMHGVPSEKLSFAELAGRTDGHASSDIREICETAAAMAMEEAVRTGGEAPVTGEHMEAAAAAVKSSTGPWYNQARRMLESTGEREFFREMLPYLEGGREQ